MGNICKIYPGIPVKLDLRRYLAKPILHVKIAKLIQAVTGGSQANRHDLLIDPALS